MHVFLSHFSQLGVKITASREEIPMGTAGPLALARELLKSDGYVQTRVSFRFDGA